MHIDRIDHFVLTVRDVDATIDFYTRVLGMEAETFGAQGRKALRFGHQKINLHVAGKEFEPKAKAPAPGSADFCLITCIPLTDVQEYLAAHNIAVEEGPVPRTGATGPITSVYLRDPDGNLVEISNET
jgi:catechol 2,3-dioxygenase-like lactoylglutathione lyase family enzyme